MLGVRDDLVIPLNSIDPLRLLEFWRWLLSDSLRPWFATALGDLFLREPNGAVWWLDVGSGELQTVARDEEQLRNLLDNPDNTSRWFGEALVDRLRQSGIVLGPGECYSYRLLPILGGEYKPENFRVYDCLTHFRVWGPIHEQLQDVPDGSQVEFPSGE